MEMDLICGLAADMRQFSIYSERLPVLMEDCTRLIAVKMYVGLVVGNVASDEDSRAIAVELSFASLPTRYLRPSAEISPFALRQSKDREDDDDRDFAIEQQYSQSVDRQPLDQREDDGPSLIQQRILPPARCQPPVVKMTTCP